MASFSGILHRPVSTAIAVAVAAVSTVSPDLRFTPPTPVDTSASLIQPKEPSVSQFSISNLFHRTHLSEPNCLPFSASAAPPAILSLYQYARLASPTKELDNLPSAPSSDALYRWHLPDPRAYRASDKPGCSIKKSQTVVVLLGWLGARQRHLKRYAEWYTSRGFHVVTFTFPMKEIVSYKVGGNAEQSVELLAEHLSGWVAEETGKNLVFHTFSNTGWLTYGVLLEKFQQQDPSLLGNIKGCIVDSAPVAAPDPQVWASGFSAAFLKKQSVATKGSLISTNSGIGIRATAESRVEQKPAVVEAALLAVLEKFFGVVLNLPAINRRLSDVLDLLSSEQPNCPQLYIYSSADKVIPAKSVESFVEQQRKAGHVVRACDFVNSPHVDHFRNHPSLYASQLTAFLEDCVITCCKDSL